MKFPVDECTGPAVAHWLRMQGHEVFSVYEEARGLDDDAIMRKAHFENWILITNYKEFGEKVYRERHPHRGLILLRLSDELAFMKIRILQHSLEGHRDQLSGQYLVVAETKLRIVKI